MSTRNTARKGRAVALACAAGLLAACGGGETEETAKHGWEAVGLPADHEVVKALQLGKGLFAAYRPGSTDVIGWLWRENDQVPDEYWALWKLGAAGGYPIIGSGGQEKIVYAKLDDEVPDQNDNGVDNELEDFAKWVDQARLDKDPMSSAADVTTIHYGPPALDGDTVAQFKKGVYDVHQDGQLRAFVWRPKDEMNREIWILRQGFKKPGTEPDPTEIWYDKRVEPGPNPDAADLVQEFVIWLVLEAEAIPAYETYSLRAIDHGLEKVTIE